MIKEIHSSLSTTTGKTFGYSLLTNLVSHDLERIPEVHKKAKVF
jgi:hypothetical protein